MDELLDLVNENDEVIGEVWRKEANSNPEKIHREIAILINDKNKRLLLQQRSLSKKKHPGMWIISCTGHVKKGDSPEETAHKELLEELGFDTTLTFVAKDFERLSDETRFCYCYTGEYNDTKMVFQKEEVETARFFTREEFEELVKTSEVEEMSEGWCRKYWETNG